MKCPKSHTENPDAKKFCHECGAKIFPLCPGCGAEVSVEDKFCGECGHNLTLPSEPTRSELSFDEKIAKLQKYLPKGITEKILSQRDRIEGERKLVTVIFCYIEGFTFLSKNHANEVSMILKPMVYLYRYGIAFCL